MKEKAVHGKDISGNESFVAVSRKKGEIYIYSPEDADYVIFTVKQARNLIKAIELAIKENE